MIRYLIAALVFIAPASSFSSQPSPPSETAAPGSASEVPAPDAEPKESRPFATVRRETLFDVTPTVGTFKARQITKIGSQVAGRVEAVVVDVGDVVKKGQALARLERNFFEIELDQRKTDIESADVGLANAKLKLDRAVELWGDGQDPPISEQYLDDAKSAYSAAQVRLHQSQQAIRFAEERLKETVIRAPYDAVVTQRFVHTGEPVQAMFITPLLEVQEVSQLELLFSLPQEALPKTKQGMTVLYRVEGLAGAQGMTTLDTIFPAMDEATRSFRCRAIVKNSEMKLRPSLLAQVGLVQRQIPNALAVPRAALLETLTGWQAQVLEDGKPVTRDVKIGLITFLDSVEVIEGLHEGDRVLLNAPAQVFGKEESK